MAQVTNNEMINKTLQSVWSGSLPKKRSFNNAITYYPVESISEQAAARAVRPAVAPPPPWARRGSTQAFLLLESSP